MRSFICCPRNMAAKQAATVTKIPKFFNRWYFHHANVF